MRSRETDREPIAQQRQGLVARSFSVLGRGFRLLLLSLLVSIAVEWLGMHWWWPEQGTEHSRAMLQSEIAYLDDNVKISLLNPDPAHFVASFADAVHYNLFGRTRLLETMVRLAPTDNAISAMSPRQRRMYHAAISHAQAAINIMQVFFARLAVLCLALPLFLIMGLVGVLDGLVQRDLRRWGGGRESSYLYHYAKRSNGAFLVTAWVVYLALPLSLPPAVIILPFAALLAVSLGITTSMFKKYL
jgi:integrating conjugative element membrane protein (TIGR03747 family)